MKKIPSLACLLTMLTLQSCFWSPQESQNASQYEPVLMNRVDFENSVQTLPPQSVIKSGKIYIKDNLMLVNDVNKGFHAYNYSDPENPMPIGFIKIPGATDLAIRDNTIYINQAVDLVTLTYNPATNAIVLSNRNENVFPQKMSPTGEEPLPSDDGIVVDWIEQ